jgi:hypothetical protein
MKDHLQSLRTLKIFNAIARSTERTDPRRMRFPVLASLHLILSFPLLLQWHKATCQHASEIRFFIANHPRLPLCSRTGVAVGDIERSEPSPAIMGTLPDHRATLLDISLICSSLFRGQNRHRSCFFVSAKIGYNGVDRSMALHDALPSHLRNEPEISVGINCGCLCSRERGACNRSIDRQHWAFSESDFLSQFR